MVMRCAGRHGLQTRALIAVLWRGGLRIPEALALSETDIDQHRGWLLVGHGKGEKRRKAGMHKFGFEQLADWLARPLWLPRGTLLCVIDGPARGRRWVATAARVERRELRRDNLALMTVVGLMSAPADAGDGRSGSPRFGSAGSSYGPVWIFCESSSPRRAR